MARKFIGCPKCIAKFSVLIAFDEGERIRNAGEFEIYVYMSGHAFHPRELERFCHWSHDVMDSVMQVFTSIAIQRTFP